MLSIEGNSISFGLGKRRTFRNTIAETIAFDDAVVVRLGSEPFHQTNENVYGLDYTGQVLWQIPIRSHVTSESPYVSISRQGIHVEVVNWDGYFLKIHPRTGAIIREGYEYWSELPSRQPSPRRWM